VASGARIFIFAVTVVLGSTPVPAAAAGVDLVPAPGSPLATDDRPNAVATGDFNEDGNRDIAFSQAGVDNVAIFLGDGAGGFAAAATSPEGVGNGPVSLATGDYDNNGKTDLAVANRLAGTVTILLGDGTGNFTATGTGPEVIGGTGLRAVATGDFNDDGDADLAVTNQTTHSVAVLLGLGNGDFAAPLTEAVGTTPVDVRVSDLNDDGKADLVVTNASSDNISILLGDGTGNFTEAGPEPAGDTPIEVEVADFDGDGRRDLAVTNEADDTVSILLGDGAGNFAPAPSSPELVGPTPVGLIRADLDLDGRPDLAAASDDGIHVLLNVGSGDFIRTPGSPEPTGGEPFGLAVDTFDQDARPDVAVTNNADDTLAVLLNREPAEEPAPAPPTDPAAPKCKGLQATIIGTPGSETIEGTDGPDVIAGLDGADRVLGLRGDDRLCGGKGDDLLKGGRGPDVLKGGSGSDECRGGAGSDSAVSCQVTKSVP
jgi:Ca2+-binding RTX toxin-like protein